MLTGDLVVFGQYCLIFALPQNPVEPGKFQVWQAYGGSEGLEIMNHRCPDAVLIDMVMPGIDGMAVVQHMKANPVLARIPIIMVSVRGPLDALISPVEGKLSLFKPSGFQIMELVQSIEALVGVLIPNSESKY